MPYWVSHMPAIEHYVRRIRLCCDFFTFQLTVEENKAFLSIAGPEGAKEYLTTEVGLQRRPNWASLQTVFSGNNAFKKGTNNSPPTFPTMRLH